MAETFFLEVATPERMMVHEAVSSAQIPAANGYIGVLPGHAALLSELGEGELSYVVEGHRHKLNIRGGWMEISGDRTRVLADTAEVPDHEP
jgi:F-type H+-transporting ATPase subunit epsilon